MPARSRPSRVLAVAVIGTFIASSLLVFVGTPSVATAASRAWTLSTSFPPVIADVEAISCFSATGCIAVGWTPADGPRPTPIELRTVDAGMLWTEVAVPHVVSMLNVVACAGTLCLAGGDGSVLLRSTDDGLTWDDIGMPFSITAVTALTCPSPTACFAEGREIGTTPSGAIVATTNAGASWTGEYQETMTYLQSLWCSTSTSCYASYGSSYLTTTDGSTWGPVPLPDGFPTLGVCPSATTCIGSSPSAGIVTSGDGGATWSTTDGDVVPTSLSCASATTCVGTDGTNLVITTDGGATWSEQSPPYADEVLLGVACLSTTNCQAVGDDSVDTYPGRALLLDVTPSTQGFSPERASNAVDAAVSASCSSTTVCAVAAVDPYGSPMLVQTVDGGTAWTDLAVPPQFAQVDQVLCASATSCLVSGSDADGQGSVWRTTDAGVAWSPGRVSASVGEVDRLQCQTSSRCEATAYLANSWTAVLMSSNAGRSWSTTPMVHTATDLLGIDCATPRDCVAVGGRNGAIGVAYYSTDGGRRWRAAKVTGALRALSGVSCVTTAVCIAASSVRHGSGSRGVIARSTDGGAAWSPVLAPGATAVVLSVSCWSPMGCEAVGQSDAATNPLDASAAVAFATSNAGRTWVTQVLPMDQWTLNSVSCARGGACVAAGVGSFYPPSLPTGATILRLP